MSSSSPEPCQAADQGHGRAVWKPLGSRPKYFKLETFLHHHLVFIHQVQSRKEEVIQDQTMEAQVPTIQEEARQGGGAPGSGPPYVVPTEEIHHQHHRHHHRLRGLPLRGHLLLGPPGGSGGSTNGQK